MPLKEGTLSNYVSDYFVETGIGQGKGVRKALAAGFKNIVSIEINEAKVNKFREEFADNGSVVIVHGDSGQVLSENIADIHGSITFWLDGHFKNKSPLFKEFAAIRKHMKQVPIILIDDVKLFTNYSISLPRVLRELKTICPDYDISYIDGVGNRKNDILVAQWK